MPAKLFSWLVTLLVFCAGCQAINSTKAMTNNEKNNPMNCDPVTGLCEIPGATASTETSAILQPINRQKPVKVLYFTDPICSSCWAATRRGSRR